MIRFLADTWRDALLRPVAMAAPNSWVYIEITAPDFRFVLTLGLAVLALIAVRKAKLRPPGSLPTLALFILVFLSFIPWMHTTGNGRYFMPYLILIGPLCVALINLTRTTPNMKAFLVIGVLGLQGFALSQNSPWKAMDGWEWFPWKEAPYFALETPKEGFDPDATYVTISLPTYSAVAPLLPDTLRWINIVSFGSSESDKQSRLYAPVKRALQDSKSLKVFMTSAPRSMVEGTVQPDQTATLTINSYLEPYDLRLKSPTDCQLVKSKSIAHRAFFFTEDITDEKARIRDLSGFWICSIQYAVLPKKPHTLTIGELSAGSLFEKMEKVCPRFFAPGQQGVGRHRSGFQRRYASDSYLIATGDGHLYFKYDRALNPELIGKAEDILAPGFAFDCTKFKGRAGLPWEREI
jgi:hypothetical protein